MKAKKFESNYIQLCRKILIKKETFGEGDETDSAQQEAEHLR